jgi:tetratricopeptide (TPR) repeat protein
MPEERTTERARLGGVSMIARNSGFTDQGKPVKPDQVSRALGARVTLEEAKNMGGPSMAAAEDAQRKFDEGMILYRKYRKADNAQARDLFLEAAKDPAFAARAYAQVAATYRQDWNFGWSTENPAALEQWAIDKANDSVNADTSKPYGHVQLAYLHLYKGEYDLAKYEAELADQLGGAIPGYSEGKAVLGQVLTYKGDPQTAVTLMEDALALVGPEPPAYYLRQLGQAYYVLGQVERYQKENESMAMEYYGKAKAELERALNHRQARLTLAAVYIESGDYLKAKALFTLDPDMRHHITIVNRKQAPYKEAWIKYLYIGALRSAGSQGGSP